MNPNFQSPIPGIGKILSGWADPRAYRGGVHEGIDFVAPMWTSVFAVQSGEVWKVNKSGEGNGGKYIFLAHPAGWMTAYMHLARVHVDKGDTVSQGQLIGESGDTGAGGPHLHFGTLLPKDKTHLYSETYGIPSTGFGPDGEKIKGHLAVPSEPLVPATYGPKVLKGARSRGVPLYRATTLIPLFLAAGVAYVIWRVTA